MEWVSVLVPVSFFIGYYFLMVGPGHEFFHSIFGILLLVTLIIVFSRLMFGAISRLQRNVQTLSRQISGQNVQLRALHAANLALSEERISASVMQRVADLGCQLFQARSAVLTVVSPLGETESRYCSPPESGDSIHNEVIGLIQQRTEPLRLHMSEAGATVPVPENDTEDDPTTVANCLGVPIIHKEILLGSLCFCRKSGEGSYTIQDEELARLFVSQAAVAIENARLSEQIEDLAVLQERDRIAREMHDGMAQVLGYINTQTIAVKKLLADEKLTDAREELSKMEAIARDLYADVREGILGLRVAAQPNKGLIPLLREYLELYRDMSGLNTITHISSAVEDLEISSTGEVQLLRIVQEALTNVRKHSGATEVTLNLEHVGDRLCIRVDDNGKGFDPANLPSSGWPRFGLRVMEERAQSLGGNLSIQTRAEGGASVTVQVPIPRIQLAKATA